MDRIEFIGNIGKDAVLETKNGTTFAKFTVAVTHFNKGEKSTEWRNVVAFGKTAEYCQKNALKGTVVYVGGSPTLRTYKNKLDEYVATMDVVASIVICLGMRENTSTAPAPTQHAHTDPSGFVQVDDDGDIPF